MIQHRVSALILLCCGGVLVCPGLAAAEPACLYESRSYSTGAYICVQKSLMLNCTNNGERAEWKLVADRELSERCVAPTALTASAVPRRHVRPRFARRHVIEPAKEVSAKCFSFNGKSYCE
jgi:Protein of unknown function (DUF1496)